MLTENKAILFITVKKHAYIWICLFSNVFNRATSMILC